MLSSFAAGRRLAQRALAWQVVAVALTALLNDLEITQGAENLALYQFNTGTAQHHFCKTCGIYTHHQRRSDPQQFGVNVACLDGISPFDFPEVPVMDGVAHPSDKGGPARVAGILRFQPPDRG